MDIASMGSVTTQTGYSTQEVNESERQVAKKPEQAVAEKQNAVNAGEAYEVELSGGKSQAQPSAKGAYDVELSKTAQKLSEMKSQTGANSVSAANSGNISAADMKAPSGGGAAVAGTSEDTDDTDTSSSTSLATYSDYQLKQMVNEGKISQSEYQTELSKREDGEEEEI